MTDTASGVITTGDPKPSDAAPIIRDAEVLADYIEANHVYARDGYPIAAHEFHRDEWALIILALRTASVIEARPDRSEVRQTQTEP